MSEYTAGFNLVSAFTTPIASINSPRSKFGNMALNAYSCLGVQLSPSAADPTILSLTENPAVGVLMSEDGVAAEAWCAGWYAHWLVSVFVLAALGLLGIGTGVTSFLTVGLIVNLSLSIIALALLVLLSLLDIVYYIGVHKNSLKSKSTLGLLSSGSGGSGGRGDSSGDY